MSQALAIAQMRQLTLLDLPGIRGTCPELEIKVAIEIAKAWRQASQVVVALDLSSDCKAVAL